MEFDYILILEVLGLIAIIVGMWKMYEKMGIAGWKSIIPVYDSYVLCKKLYGNGMEFLLILVPIYNIYFYFKVYVDLAHGFNKKTSFGIILSLLPFIFIPVLGFGSSKYGDGTEALKVKEIFPDATSKAKELSSAAISKTKELSSVAISKTKEFSESAISKAKELPTKLKTDEHALEKLEQLYNLKEKGVISEEEYNSKKEEMLKRM